MCGVCGIYNFNQKEIDVEILKTINDKLKKRGPDSGGVFSDKYVGLGNRRLKIIDFEGGGQPFYNKNGDIVLVYNGEIYNYLELKQELEVLGHRFKSKSDTEVLLKMYETFGEKMLDKINGMFAFSIWDKNKDTLFIARDRLGIKPLYYHTNKNGLIFSSTLNSMINLYEKEIDEDSILFYFFTGYVPSPKTIWKNFYKLEAGHYITIKNNNIKIKKYWDISVNEDNKINSKNINTHFEKIKETILHSNKIQSRSDANVSVFLSGGIDSSIIAKLYAKNSNKKFNTYTLDFEGKKNKEIDNVKSLIKDNKNINNIYEVLSLSENKEILEKIFEIFDEPNSDSASIPSFLLSRSSKKNNDKVVLNGCGGDELFGGYDRYYIKKKFYLGNIFNKLKLILGIKGNLFDANDNLLNYEIKLCNPTIRFVTNTSGMNLGFLRRILGKELFLRGCNLVEQKFSVYDQNLKINGSSFAGMLTDIKFYLPDNLLYIADQTSMENSIEMRVPLLDHRIIDLIFKTPKELFFGKNFKNSKKTLKNIFRSLLNKKIIETKKSGFNAPSNEWVKNNPKYFQNEILNIKKSNLNNYVSFSEIEKILKSQKKINKYSHEIYSLFCLKKWFDFHA
tara:strand:- start:4002 stop:5861 length:1860 start_codon:yes stop_codon:yes gene_type:complete